MDGAKECHKVNIPFKDLLQKVYWRGGMRDGGVGTEEKGGLGVGK